MLTPAWLVSIGLLSTLALAQPPATPVPARGEQVQQPKPPADAPYRILKTIEIGGEGGWDCISIDSASGRVYIPRSTRVTVVDTETGKVVGEVSDTAGVHAVAVAPALNKGFATNGKANTVTVFDLKTLATIATVPAGKGPDIALFDSSTNQMISFNAASHDATVIDAATLKVVGTIDVVGKPEFACAAGNGIVYVNIEDSSEIVKLDTKAMTVLARWPLAPGVEPTGLAFDPGSQRLFAACHNLMMVVVDAKTGKVVGTAPIGEGVDGAEFDVSKQLAFSSNGEGTLTVISNAPVPKEALPNFPVVQTLPTARGARTMVLDPKTGRIYLPTAEFEAPAAPADGKPAGRPKMKAGTFKVFVVGK